MGCCCATWKADSSPELSRKSEVISPKEAATIILRFANITSRFLSRYHALIPITNKDAKTYPLLTVCRNLLTALGLKMTSAKFSISFLAVSGLKCIPTGCCIQPLAMSIHKAERLEPIATSHVESRCILLLTLSQPKNITAKKVDSIKNAMRPSMASGAPKMSPTIHE